MSCSIRDPSPRDFSIMTLVSGTNFKNSPPFYNFQINQINQKNQNNIHNLFFLLLQEIDMHQNIKISWKDAQKVDFRKFTKHILEFYTKNSPRNSWSPHFMITLLNQKSQNGGGPPVSLFFFSSSFDLNNFNVCNTFSDIHLITYLTYK